MQTELDLVYKPILQTSIVAKIQNIPVLSFFTGAGFLDLGFTQAGFDIVWHNEYNPAFIQGFEFAFSNLSCKREKPRIENTNSIIQVEPKTILQEAFRSNNSTDTFGIIGGPPCPDFSNGGKHKGKDGDHGRLSQVYVDRILELEPTFFLFENVPGLLRAGKHRSFLISLMKQLSEKYLIDLRVLNALEYGVPQDRERVFLLGFHNDWINKKFGPKFLAEHNWNIWAGPLQKYLKKSHRPEFIPKETWFNWPEPRFPKAKKSFPWPDTNPFGETLAQPIDIPEELTVAGNFKDLTDLPNSLDLFIPKSDKFNRIEEGDVSGKSFKRLHRWRYSPPAAYGNNEVHLHPTEPRRLSVREAMRIQSVPDDYQLPENMFLTQKFKTIGNGVPVKLANFIATSIGDFLNQYS